MACDDVKVIQLGKISIYNNYVHNKIPLFDELHLISFPEKNSQKVCVMSYKCVYTQTHQ